MEIQTMKDMKDALSNIPDEVLERFGAGIDVEAGEKVSLLCWADEPHEQYGEDTEKYPVLEKIGKWIENIVKEQSKDQDSINDRDQPISSDE